MTSIIIQNKFLYLELSAEMGASVIKFFDKRKKIDIFRPFPKEKRISKYNSYFTGYFATAPYFGAIQKKSFFFKNKYISLPKTHIFEPHTIHGEGWVNKWKIAKLNQNSVELVFKHNGKNSFPYSYKVKQLFKLSNNSLSISISLENMDKNNFDCGIGFHPWFNLSKNSKIYSNNFLFLKKKKDNTFSKKKFIKKNYIDLNKYKTDTTFLNWIGKSKLTINNNLSINIKNKKNVSNLHVYSPAKKNFFCIEPVTNYRDAYYIKKLGSQFHGLKNLKPKKTFKASVEFEILN